MFIQANEGMLINLTHVCELRLNGGDERAIVSSTFTIPHNQPIAVRVGPRDRCEQFVRAARRANRAQRAPDGRPWTFFVEDPRGGLVNLLACPYVEIGHGEVSNLHVVRVQAQSMAHTLYAGPHAECVAAMKKLAAALQAAGLLLAQRTTLGAEQEAGRVDA